METKEFEVIDAINRDGMDSSLWGLCREEVNASVYEKQFRGVLPPHIYVYGSDDEVYGYELDRLLKDGYDEKIYCEPGRYIAFFWLKA